MKRFAAGLLALAITASLNAPAHAAGPARPLASNGDARGEITSATPVNYSDGSRSQLFALQLSANQAVSLKIEGALNGVISVFHQDMLVTRTTPCECANGSTQVGFRADKAGQYLVAVSGANARAFGPFRLSATPIQTYDGKPLKGEAHITDWLINGGRNYTLQVDTAGLYTIDLKSTEFDTRLDLSGNGMTLQDDDGGQGTNARLVAPLQPGEYTISANTFYGGEGAFYLDVQRADLNEGMVFESGHALPIDETVSGFIRSDEPLDFVLTLPERRRVQIDTSGDNLDTYLSLQGMDINLSDDDSGGGLNARLSQVLDAGEYNVSVRSMSSSGGLLRISTSTAPAPDGPTRPQLALGKEMQGQLSPGMRNLYTLEIPRKGNYIISMTGNNGLDGMLTLMRGGEEVASQDDGDASLDPRMEVELEPGRYLLMAHSFDQRASGSYRLQARRK